MAASREKILKAQLLWSDIQEKMSESEWEGFIKKYGNPLVPPVDETRLDEFILNFSEIYLGKKTPEQIAAAIDKKQLRGFIDEYETGAKRISEIQAQADIRGKEYVQAQIKRNQEIVRHALEARVQANQKEATYKKLKEESEKQPNSPVEKIASTVVSKIEDATPFFQKEEDVADFVKEQSFFSKLKGRNIIQKAASPIADAVITVFPDLRQGVLNKNFEAELQKILKAPEALMDKLGIKAVDTDAFKLMARRVQTGLSQTSKPGGARTFIDDVTASVFHKSFTITAEQSVVTYWEVVHTSLMQDKPIPSANQFMASGMGMGPSLVHMGVNMGINKAKGWAIQKGITVAGGEALAAALGGPPTWIAGLLALGTGLLGKVGGWMKKLAGIKEGMVPGDLEIVSIGCGTILLVFFILPIVSQLNIDSSLATRLQIAGGGPSAQNQYLDITITATPVSLAGNRPTAIRYDACVKPKGSPASFKINSASINFTVFGSSNNIKPDVPNINQSSFTNGCTSFTIPTGSEYENAVITATINANADAGATTSVNGAASVSTIIGNPTIACFAFGGAGQADAYGHTSSTWDSTAAVTAAIGILSRSPAYMSQVCTGNRTITVYRVKADFGGGSTSPPDAIFMYNACATTSCATYTLAHETGHIVDSRTGLFNQYNSLGLYTREGPMWTYPNGFSEHEDFAETLGAYVVWHNYTWGARHGHGAGNLDYTSQYPLHYQFAKEIFGGVEY